MTAISAGGHSTPWTWDAAGNRTARDGVVSTYGSGDRLTAIDGTDMERHPRTVDTEVTRPIGEPATGVDSQLDAAIRSLLARLGRAE